MSLIHFDSPSQVTPAFTPVRFCLTKTNALDQIASPGRL